MSLLCPLVDAWINSSVILCLLASCSSWSVGHSSFLSVCFGSHLYRNYFYKSLWLVCWGTFSAFRFKHKMQISDLFSHKLLKKKKNVLGFNTSSCSHDRLVQVHFLVQWRSAGLKIRHSLLQLLNIFNQNIYVKAFCCSACGRARVYFEMWTGWLPSCGLSSQLHKFHSVKRRNRIYLSSSEYTENIYCHTLHHWLF